MSEPYDNPYRAEEGEAGPRQRGPARIVGVTLIILGLALAGWCMRLQTGANIMSEETHRRFLIAYVVSGVLVASGIALRLVTIRRKP